ncbi:HD domain-containing protein [Clostridium sp. 'deep sea']|uniref:HD-GYP domain-containing protein n=1 Tax=Clostridium sp. 'deep sea' TaxID=2779445 RepID=UPI0018966893|nr:HD domain-containing phosphohydrolase [Clostridium sp. 'deep sea']QOR36545.1 HD domain-containing protein [Clostridium sp. 'deep sea']
MKGFFIEKSGGSLEKVSQNSATLELLARGDGTEILMQEIKANKVIQVVSQESSSVMEFFYVLDGSLAWLKNSEEEILQAGDYFYTHHFKGKEYLKTLSETKLLYVSTQPIFHYISKQIKDLMEMVNSVEKKDYYTHSHGKRVHDISGKVAQKLGITGERLEKVLYAALFHDIGKIKLSDNIVGGHSKPTAEEWELIKMHPIFGKEIVEQSFLRYIGPIIVQHHERLDGSGYPYGLKGEEISLEARIISLVDAYDAMTTNRSYREAKAVEEAIVELAALTETKFDKQVYDIFVDILIEEGEYRPSEDIDDCKR